MSAPVAADVSSAPPSHSRAFRLRRFANWFPLGFAYALLYMGRYNLNVAKTGLGLLMTPEDFGVIFGVGAVVYGFAFIVNGPLTDRLGGRRMMLVAILGAAISNIAMGAYISHTLALGTINNADLRLWLSVLYAVNMYFQSFGAVAIIKVNASWFHVRERGGFSGVFGTMISAGLFLAFTVNGWVAEAAARFLPGTSEVARSVWVFHVPAVLLLVIFLVELVLLRDRPAQAGQADFDTGDSESGETGDVPFKQVFIRVLTNPVILTVALIEFCTGVARHAVQQYYPIYADEVLALPRSHPLVQAPMHWSWTLPFIVVSVVCFGIAARLTGKRRGILMASGLLIFLTPFVTAGWGGLLFVAGVIGGNVAGYVSDIFFQSRRAPAAGGLYAVLFLCSIAMMFVMGRTKPVVAESHVPELQVGDRILSVAGQADLKDWKSVRDAFARVPAQCLGGSRWDTQHDMCSTAPASEAATGLAVSTGFIRVNLERNGQRLSVDVKDPKASMRAGDQPKLAATPVASLSPYWLGMLAAVMSICVIGVHGLLSGTATMDFGGRKGAATATGLIDGFVYLGTAVQSVGLGYLTTRSWSYWPWFLMPFTLAGFLLCLRIWNAKPQAKRAQPAAPQQPPSAPPLASTGS